MQAESTQLRLASQRSKTLVECDAFTTAAEGNGQQLQKNIRENKLLEKQVGDLSKQLCTLLKELSQHQDPSLLSDKKLEHDEMLQPVENIEVVITNNLVLFCSIPQFQEQNQKLLKIVHKLGSKLESKKREYKEALECKQGEVVHSAHEVIKQLQAQLETSNRAARSPSRCT